MRNETRRAVGLSVRNAGFEQFNYIPLYTRYINPHAIMHAHFNEPSLTYTHPHTFTHTLTHTQIHKHALGPILMF